MSRLLHQAEATIKRAVNAGPQGRIVACGTGATGAIDKLQQILGVALPPVTRKTVGDELRAFLGTDKFEAFREYQQSKQPVVFVGPYEHHSNEVTWRQGLATVVEVNLAADGGIDLAHLESLLQAPEYQGRLRIGSFSAASNVTGMRSPVREIAKLLHANDAFACFDYAASAPYVDIDMNPPLDDDGGDASLDAVFLSPHKFLGGPGSSGVLVFNERLYSKGLGAERRGRRHRGLREPPRPGLHRRHRGARKGRHARCAADVEGRPGARPEAAHRRGTYRGARARTAAACASSLVRARRHRSARQSRPVAAHRHRVVQFARCAGPLPAPEVRHGPAERSFRYPVARRVFMCGSLRAPVARHRPADLRAVSRLGAQGVPGHQAGLVSRRLSLRDGRRRSGLCHRAPSSSSPPTAIDSCRCIRSMRIPGHWSHRSTRSTTRRFRSMPPWPRVLRVARRCRWKRGARCISDAWRKRGRGRAGWASQRCRPRRWSWRRRSASYSFSTSASPELYRVGRTRHVRVAGPPS